MPVHLLRAYPALVAAGLFALGCAWAALWPGYVLWWIGVGGAGLALLALLWVPSRRLVSARPFWYTLCAGVLVVAVGGLRYSTSLILPPAHLYRLVQALGLQAPTVTLTGRIASPPVYHPAHTTFDLAVDTLRDAGLAYTTEGRVRVRVYALQAWKRGNVVQVQGRLRLAGPRRNPADFDYGAYLKRKDIYGTVSVYEADQVRLLAHRPRSYERLLDAVRAYVQAAVDARLPAPATRPLLLALLLGDRAGLTTETQSWFRQTGLIHLLAISGLHVFLIGMMVYRLSRPMLLRLGLRWHSMECTRAGATLALLWLYILLTGAPASAVRAGVMAAVFVLGPPLRRATEALNALGLAALVLLLARPTHLFDPGFQLSFSAVFGLLQLYPRLRAWCPERVLQLPVVGWAAESMLVSLAATLATMPALYAWFGQVAWAGLVLNIAAIPLSGGLLCSGVLTVLTHGGAGFLASAWGAAGSACAAGLLAVAQYGAAAQAWTVHATYIRQIWALLGLVLVLMGLSAWSLPRLRWKLLLLALAMPVLGIWLSVARGEARPRLEVLFFDVGQGDAALVTLSNRKTLLVDAGGRGLYTDQGRRTLLPHLRRYGIDRLDAVLLSHPHADHIGGLPALLRALPVGRVIDNGQAMESPLYREIAHLVDSLGIAHQSVTAADTLAMDPLTHLQILHPITPPSPETDPNEASVVLRLQYGATTVLFTGDAERGAEARLLAHFPPRLLRSTLVKVGHHGSETSSTAAFVEAVRHPQGGRAVISVAARNSYGLPDPEIVERWAAHQMHPLQTRTHGALWLRSDGRGVTTVDWR